ncbi:hypothetical protein LTR78_000702 [Recurvomyces mirabilis]|uniref:Uncharacterized protein n=1 Tax=Recurvomyces mirabilis TaxID=574656 RepID=A0AAE0WVK4_9PEZI|nr:hypothetical protein LTR78_000702 [Recurvomyces mirabilis]KAK5158672.1 hypothetical protein LTS14_002780 [Recurvomyces mirabilis]
MTTYKATLRNDNGVKLGEVMDRIHFHLKPWQSQTQYRMPAHMHLHDDHEALKKRLYNSFVGSLGFQLAVRTNKGHVSSRSCWIDEGHDNRESERLTEEMREELF